MTTRLMNKPSESESREVLSRWGVDVSVGTDLAYAVVFAVGIALSLLAPSYLVATGRIPASVDVYVAWALALAWSPLPVSISSVAQQDIRDAWGLKASPMRRCSGLYPYLFKVVPVSTFVALTGFAALVVNALVR